MFILYANKTNLTVRKREAMTSGSVNVYQVQFEFSEDWEGLTKTAVFETRGRSRAVLLDDTGLCTIPREVLAVPKTTLRVGVYGAWGDMVLPTVWANLGAILEGAAPAGGLCPSAPELWEQALAGKGDGLALDGQTLKLLSGEETLSQVELPASGGGPGSEEPPGPQGEPGPIWDLSVNGDTVIGKWINGKRLYMRVYEFMAPSKSMNNQNVFYKEDWMIDIESVITIFGELHMQEWPGELFFPLGCTNPGEDLPIAYIACCYDYNNGLLFRIRMDDDDQYFNKPVTSIWIYTKKSDMV